MRLAEELITVTTLQVKKACKVFVQDTGVGIPHQALADLFSPFFQAHQEVSTTVKGTGLGLAICKGLIEGHHGTIEVQSAVGRGTTFCFELPSTIRQSQE